PVLGEALFGDVDAGHDLDAADQRAAHAVGDVVALDALAVDAVADPHAVLHRLDVDIAGGSAGGFSDGGVGEVDDRRLGRVVHPVFADAGEVNGLVPRALDTAVHRAVEALVHALAQAVDGAVHRLVDGVGRRLVEQLVDDALDAGAGGDDGADVL